MNRVPTRASPGGILAAWLVHLLTASGVVIAMLALLAVERGDFRTALLWLVLGLGVDAFDGTLARKARVKERAARIDGDTLDLIIDYLTYVFVPALLIVRSESVPDSLAPGLGALILVSALYNFTRRDLKTVDNYFRGFPALWNVVAFYFFVAPPSPEVAVLSVVGLAALTFAPIHFVHPFRVTDYGIWLPALALLWAAATLALIWPDWSPAMWTGLFSLSMASAIILVGMGLFRSLRGVRTDGNADGA